MQLPARARPGLFITLWLTLCLCVSCTPNSGSGDAALPRVGIVARVVDGDTVKLESGERVRYIGIDTPETKRQGSPVEFMGREASAYNAKLVEHKRITLEYDVETRDKYNRILAYVYVGEVFVNAALVEQGFAKVLTIPPNVKHAQTFLDLQRKAQKAGIGLWAGGR